MKLFFPLCLLLLLPCPAIAAHVKITCIPELDYFRLESLDTGDSAPGEIDDKIKKDPAYRERLWKKYGMITYTVGKNITRYCKLPHHTIKMAVNISEDQESRNCLGAPEGRLKLWIDKLFVFDGSVIDWCFGTASASEIVYDKGSLYIYGVVGRGVRNINNPISNFSRSYRLYDLSQRSREELPVTDFFMMDEVWKDEKWEEKEREKECDEKHREKGRP